MRLMILCALATTLLADGVLPANLAMKAQTTRAERAEAQREFLLRCDVECRQALGVMSAAQQAAAVAEKAAADSCDSKKVEWDKDKGPVCAPVETKK